MTLARHDSKFQLKVLMTEGEGLRVSKTTTQSVDDDFVPPTHPLSSDRNDRKSHGERNYITTLIHGTNESIQNQEYFHERTYLPTN